MNVLAVSLPTSQRADDQRLQVIEVGRRNRVDGGCQVSNVMVRRGIVAAGGGRLAWELAAQHAAAVLEVRSDRAFAEKLGVSVFTAHQTRHGFPSCVMKLALLGTLGERYALEAAQALMDSQRLEACGLTEKISGLKDGQSLLARRWDWDALLAELRAALGDDERALRSTLRVSRAALAAWRAGSRSPGPETKLALLAALGHQFAIEAMDVVGRAER